MLCTWGISEGTPALNKCCLHEFFIGGDRMHFCSTLYRKYGGQLLNVTS